MRNYFNHRNAMQTTDKPKIQSVFQAADNEPERFIRIMMDENGMFLDSKGRKEYRILNARVFVWFSNTQRRVIDFALDIPNRYFYAALADNAGVGFKINASECTIEGYQEFLDPREKDAQGMFCIFKIDCGTVLITYHAADKYIGFSYAPDTPESDSVADQLYEMFDLVIPDDAEEIEAEE